MNFVVYQRVSTKKQDYGLDAQALSISQYLKTVPFATVLATLSEKESGADNDRPKLKEALALCKATGAKLLCAKLDRLSRNASFLLQLQESGVDFVIAEMPFCDKFSVSILACVAQKEREMISERTRQGLAVARARGVRLGAPPESLALARLNAQKAIAAKKEGFARDSLKAIREVQSAGVLSYNRIADCLNKRGEKTARGGKWTAKAVSRVLETALYLAPEGSTLKPA
jgi:DNA invertase Pin-like site-specific DNA recombinase